MAKHNKGPGRPASKNVPYFPHFTEPSSELKFLEKRFGSDGYKAYYRIFELLAKTDDHHIMLQTENQKLTFLYEVRVEEEIIYQAIDYLIEMKILDKQMWNEKKILWCDSFVKNFKGVYYKRGTKMPEKVGNEIISGTRNREYSKVEKTKEKKKIEKNTIEEKTIDNYLNVFSYKRLKNGKRLAYCGECYNEHTFENVSKIASSLSDCCQGSFIPDAPMEVF